CRPVDRTEYAVDVVVLGAQLLHRLGHAALGAQLREQAGLLGVGVRLQQREQLLQGGARVALLVGDRAPQPAGGVGDLLVLLAGPGDEREAAAPAVVTHGFSCGPPRRAGSSARAGGPVPPARWGEGGT